MKTREYRIAQRERIIAHNRAVYSALVRGTIWFEAVNEDGTTSRYTGGNVHRNKQEGRWSTYRLSGHRRYEKWCRDYYRSGADEKAVRCWEEDYFEYLSE